MCNAYNKDRKLDVEEIPRSFRIRLWPLMWRMVIIPCTRQKHLNMWITMLSVEKGSTCVLAVHLRLPYRAVKYHPLPPPLGLRQNECLRKNGVFRSQKMPLGLCRNEECWKWIPLRVYLIHYEQMYDINVPQVSPEGEKCSKGLSYTESLP